MTSEIVVVHHLSNRPNELLAGPSETKIKSYDKNHLLTTGHEGWVGTQDLKLYKEIHAGRDIDYLTIHIWPKNWGWFEDRKLAAGFPNALAQTIKYTEITH